MRADARLATPSADLWRASGTEPADRPADRPPLVTFSRPGGRVPRRMNTTRLLLVIIGLLVAVIVGLLAGVLAKIDGKSILGSWLYGFGAFLGAFGASAGVISLF